MTKAMIAAFAVNKRDHDEDPFVPHSRSPMSPIMVDGIPGKMSGTRNAYAQFGWLIKG